MLRFATPRLVNWCSWSGCNVRALAIELSYDCSMSFKLTSSSELLLLTSLLFFLEVRFEFLFIWKGCGYLSVSSNPSYGFSKVWSTSLDGSWFFASISCLTSAYLRIFRFCFCCLWWLLLLTEFTDMLDCSFSIIFLSTIGAYCCFFLGGTIWEGTGSNVKRSLGFYTEPSFCLYYD